MSDSLSVREPSDFRTLGPWFTSVFFSSYATTLYLAGCYDYADKQLHASAPARLWVSAIWGFAYIFIALAAGKISEKTGPRRALVFLLPTCVGSALVGLFMFSLPHASWLIWLLAAAMLPFNVSSTACWPALESAISQTSAHMRLSTRMALYNISWALAGFMAFFTRGALEEVSWLLIFIGPAFFMLLSMLILLKGSHPQQRIGKEHVPEEQGGETELDTPELRQRARTLLHMAWIGNALAYVSGNVIIPVMMALAAQAGIENLTVAGFATSAWGFTRVAAFFVIIRWTGWHYKASWLLGSQLALAISFFLMLFVHNTAVLVVMQLVFGCCTALVYSSSLYYAMHTSEGAGGHAGFHEALIGVGICLGPAIGAIAGGQAVGLQALHRIAFSVTAVLLLGTGLMAILSLQRPRKTVTLPAE